MKKLIPEYKLCVEIYFDFIKKQTGVEPNFTNVEGKALKNIIKWIHQNQKKEMTIENTVNAFKFIFLNFDKWDAFHQKQLKLVQINSNIINIVNAIKNGQSQRVNQYYNAIERFVGVDTKQ
jgi:hypothetical protein